MNCARTEAFVCFASAASNQFVVRHGNATLLAATCTASAVFQHIQLQRQEHRLSTSGSVSTAKGWQVRGHLVSSAYQQHLSRRAYAKQVLSVVGASRRRAAPRSQSVGRRAKARRWSAPLRPSKQLPSSLRTAKVIPACAHHRTSVQSLQHPRFGPCPTCCLTIRSTGPIAACGKRPAISFWAFSHTPQRSG